MTFYTFQVLFRSPCTTAILAVVRVSNFWNGLSIASSGLLATGGYARLAHSACLVVQSGADRDATSTRTTAHASNSKFPYYYCHHHQLGFLRPLGYSTITDPPETTAILTYTAAVFDNKSGLLL